MLPPFEPLFSYGVERLRIGPTLLQRHLGECAPEEAGHRCAVFSHAVLFRSLWIVGGGADDVLEARFAQDGAEVLPELEVATTMAMPLVEDLVALLE